MFSIHVISSHFQEHYALYGDLFSVFHLFSKHFYIFILFHIILCNIWSLSFVYLILLSAMS